MIKQLILLSILLLVLGPFQMIDNVRGGGPSVSSITIDPEDPNILDDVNITISLTEPASKVEIEYCMEGPGGLCFPPEDMSPLGSNMMFSYEYTAGTFENASFHFNISIHHDGGKNYFEFYITVRAVPTSITITDLNPPASDTITVFPESNISISGRVIDDLQFPVEGAAAALGIRDGLDIWSGLTDDDGRFQFEISFEDNGSYTLDLSINDTSYGLEANASWMLMVNSWPVPAVTLETQLVFDPKSRPPGVPDFEFFIGSKIVLEYTFRNTGTGTALNFTVNERVNNTNHFQTRLIGNLSAGIDHRSNISLPTEMVGEYILELNCSYDQIAPQHLKIGPPFYSLQYKIIKKPTWESHKVLVEMFTQSTCVPCVSMEEAIERLHSEAGGSFEFMMYELDDQVSRAHAQARGVTGTPHVFIDNDFDQIMGGGDVEDLISDLEDVIKNAASRITPPVTLSLLEGMANITLVADLSDVYDRSVSGYAVVYNVESYSNQRNNQGIPLMNRFTGEVGRIPSLNLGPGQDIILDLPYPPDGQDLVAILYDMNGTVLQVKRTNRALDPVVYLKRTTIITDIIGNGSDDFLITIESFSHEAEAYFDITFTISLFGLLPDLEVADGSGRTIDEKGLMFEFVPNDSKILEVGRRVHWMDIPLRISSSVDGEGISSFKINLTSFGSQHSMSIVVRMDRAPGDDFSIVDFNLTGEGRSIFFTATVLNLPPGAILKGWVQPCTVDGPGGSCGMPIELTLSGVNDTFFKAPVNGLVLDSFDHLTFKLRVILDDEVIFETREEKVLISDIIDIERDPVPADPSSGGFTIILSLSLILLAVLVAVVLVMLISKKKKEAAISISTPDHPLTESDEAPLDEMISTPDGDGNIDDELNPDQINVEVEETPPSEDAGIMDHEETLDKNIENGPDEQSIPSPGP